MLTSSDREGNKAIVLLDVSLQDVGAGTQDSLEAWPVQFDALQRSTCSNSGSTGPVHQQGDLSWGTQESQPVICKAHKTAGGVVRSYFTCLGYF